MIKFTLTAVAALLAISGTAAANETDTLVTQGAYIARLGDCVACHTAPGGKPFAGGLQIQSDLGTIYSTNITPDKDTGIGTYSEEEFSDAVRHGVRKDGANLYPAMPFTAYNKISDEDIHALYTYLMKGVKPVSNKVAETDLGFPFNQRWGLTFWKWAFNSSSGFKPVASASDDVNRGAYLVEGLGHCGSCHTPRGFGMQQKAYSPDDEDYLAGGSLNGWHVPSLRAKGDQGAGIAGWSEQDIVDYLAEGRNSIASVGGEMKAVVEHSTAYMTDGDLKAIAAFLKTLPANTADVTSAPSEDKAAETTRKLSSATDLTLGQRLYLDNCGACHFVDGKGAAKVFPQLDGASIVNADNPTGLIHTILAGATTPSTDKAPSKLLMPGFGHRLNDKEVAALATFVRKGWSNSASEVTTEQVSKVRETINDAH